MTPRIEIKKTRREGKIAITESWIFRFYEIVVYLDAYTITRKEGRKTIASDSYSRPGISRSNIIIADVPLTDEIKQEALDRFSEQLTVKTWEEKDV